MAILLGHGARGQRPVGPPVLNLGSPQARGLLAVHPLAGDTRDLVRGGVAAATGVTFGAYPELGLVSRYTTSPAYVDLGVPTMLSSAITFSAAAWVLTDTTSPSAGGGGLRYLFGAEGGSDVAAFVCRYSPSSGHFQAYQWGSGGYQGGEGATTVVANRLYHVAVTCIGSTLSLYVDGVLDGSWSVSASLVPMTSTRYYIGSMFGDTARQWSGLIADHRLAACAWSPAEVWALYDPATRWDLYWQRRRVYVSISAGGGFTLSAESGAFSWSGTAATLKTARKVDAASGSYAWSGTAATLRFGKRLPADSGSFAWSGTAAALRVARLLAAAAGSFTWSGTAATLVYDNGGYSLSAEPGTFAWTGTAASLEFGRLLTASAGSFTWNGTAATLRRGRVMAADAGAFTWGGTAATLTLDRLIEALSGTITWTGTAALITWSGEPNVKLYVTGSYQPQTAVVGAYLPSLPIVGSPGHI